MAHKKPKDLVKREHTEEEETRIARYFERAKREPAKIKSAEDDPVDEIFKSAMLAIKKGI